MLDFTYSAYVELIKLLREYEYQLTSYLDYENVAKPVILRHDIDNSITKALRLATIEAKQNVKSVYFVLLTSDFYNIFSKKSYEGLVEILNMGHQIGLHFDEGRYTINNEKQLKNYIEYEKNILEGILNQSVNVVSMHRPSKWILENNITFKNIINAYSETFFKDFKYLSDSRMYWREDVFATIQSNKYDKLHILTHPFWYGEHQASVRERIKIFIGTAGVERYWQLKDNIRGLEDIVTLEDIGDVVCIKGNRS